MDHIDEESPNEADGQTKNLADLSHSELLAVASAFRATIEFQHDSYKAALAQPLLVVLDRNVEGYPTVAGVYRAKNEKDLPKIVSALEGYKLLSAVQQHYQLKAVDNVQVAVIPEPR